MALIFSQICRLLVFMLLLVIDLSASEPPGEFLKNKSEGLPSCIEL